VYPTVDDSTVINGTTYASWWANFLTYNVLTSPNLPNAPVPATAYPYDTNYGRISASTANGGSCGASWTTVAPLGAIFAGPLTNGVGDGNQGFCHTFKFMSKSDSVNPRPGEICWRRDATANDPTNLPPNSAANATLEFGSPRCSSPTNPSDPLIMEFMTPWGLGRWSTGPDSTYQYRGSALIYVHQSPVSISQTLQSTCSAAPCTNEKFPENNLLMLIVRNGNVSIANTGGPANDVVDRFMAYVYTEKDISVRKHSNLIGSLRAQQFCFNNASAANCSVGGGGGFPRFYQASFTDLRQIPAELPASSGASGNRWVADLVPRFWMQCRRGPGDTLPTTPTGTCQYQ
jgi:hypothetical protein